MPVFIRFQVARNVKDSKLIPPLTFAVEQYESLLAMLSKKSKVFIYAFCVVSAASII